MNKLIQLALFFTLIVTGCSNSSTSSEPKAETVKTAVAFNQKELELKKLKPVSLKMKFESPLAAELGKLKAKEEAEKQRQIEAAKKREKEREAKRKKQQEEEAERQRLAERQAAAERQRLAEAERQAELERQRQAAIQKEQEENAEKKRQSQAQRQQTEAPSSNSQHAPASELPNDDGYGYEERKKWHDDQVEWGIKQGYIDPEDAP